MIYYYVWYHGTWEQYIYKKHMKSKSRIEVKSQNSFSSYPADELLPQFNTRYCNTRVYIASASNHTPVASFNNCIYSTTTAPSQICVAKRTRAIRYLKVLCSSTLTSLILKDPRIGAISDITRVISPNIVWFGFIVRVKAVIHYGSPNKALVIHREESRSVTEIDSLPEPNVDFSIFASARFIFNFKQLHNRYSSKIQHRTSKSANSPITAKEMAVSGGSSRLLLTNAE